MRKFFMICILGLATTAACRSDSNSTADAPKGDGNGTVDSIPATTIKAMRMTQPTNGAMIALQNVVVTAHVTSSKYGHIWVQDQGGGAYSGIQLFCNYGGTAPSCMMTRAQLNALVSGTVVNVTGKFSSFLLSTAPAGAQPNLEIVSPMITPTGANMPAVAVDVTPDVIAKDQLAAATAEPYKGALVHVTGTSFTATNLTATEFATTCNDMSTPPKPGTTFGGFEVSSGGKVLSIGLSFYSTVTYCFMPTCVVTGGGMPYPCGNALTANEIFTSVKGIVEPEYNKNGQVYLQIAPTTDTDLPHS